MRSLATSSQSVADLAESLLAYCRHLIIPEPILAFLRKKLDAIDSAEAGIVVRVEEQRRRALAGLEQEERELLGMRMRQLVSDAEFQEERESLRRRRQELERSQAAAPTRDSALEARKAEVSGLLDLAHGLPLVIEKGDPFQVRAILQQLHLEIALRSRRLDVSTTKPLSLLITAGVDSSWSPREDLNLQSLAGTSSFPHYSLRSSAGQGSQRTMRPKVGERGVEPP